MSDNDDDYMSDKYVLGSEATTKAPSLMFKPSQKREFEKMKKKADVTAKIREKNKSVKLMEQEKREEGLSSAISSSNKGFEMLMKMGYKPGQGIGKTESGRSEPIPMDLKVNRLGLGKCETKKKLAKKNINPTEKLDNLNTDNFRDRIAAKKLEQLADVDLYKSQKVCEQLDTKNNIKEPQHIWYWPIVKKEKNSDDEEEEEDGDDENTEEPENEDDKLSTIEKLELLTKYLRKNYFYCIWCGATYDDNDDLKDNCPGSTRNDH